MPANAANATGFSASKKITVVGAAVPLPKWQVSLATKPAQVETNQTIVFSGAVKTASGAAGSGTVTIQKRPATGGDWTNWKTAALAANGSYSLAVKMTAAEVSSVRARMPANAANATGFSASKKITVVGAAVPLPKWQVSLATKPAQVETNQTIVFSGCANRQSKAWVVLAAGALGHLVLPHVSACEQRESESKCRGKES
jgi:hypothetical protein